MWILKKIVTILLINLLTITPIFQVNALSNSEKNIAIKQILISKNDLKKMKNWPKYIKTIDTLAEKLKKDPKRLDKVSTNIQNALIKLNDKQNLSSNEQLIYHILTYLDARIEFIKLDNTQELLDAEETAFNQILESVRNPNISESYKKALETAIINIQTNLLDKAQQDINSIIWEFETYFNYENTGDFEMDLNIDHESIWVVHAEIKLSDYVTQNVNFDSRFKSHLSAMIDATPKGGDAVKLEMKSFIDFISKDENYYALIKDLDIITEENLDEVQEFIDTLKELAQENKYIEFSSPESQQAMEMVKSIHPDNLFNDAKVLFAKPMFTAYKKQWETYSIIPTKYACDTLKVLANKFDPFNPDSCTGDQYDNFIKYMLSFWELTMTLGKENILAYTAHKTNDLDAFDASITFTDESITKINVNIIPDQEKYINEKAVLSYEKNKSLNIDLFIDKGDFKVNFDGILDKNNKFSSIKHSTHFKDYSDLLDWNLVLKNRKITGNFSAISSKGNYNYETGEYEKVQWDGFFSEISGSTNSKNELKSLNITFNGKDKGEEYINWEFLYDLPKIKLIANINDRYLKSNIIFDWQWNSLHKKLDQFSTSIEVLNKERIYNEETYSYENTEKETKVFDLNYSLENKKITGNMKILDDKWEFIFSVNSKWEYEKNKMSLDNNIEINKIFISSLTQDIENENPIININFWYDYTNNNANSDLFINAMFEWNKVLDLNIKNTGTIEYKKIDIKKPINTNLYQDVLWDDIY
jgi:hypothetical protein